MKPKILFLSGDMDRAGGTERVTAIVANELARHGYPICILSVQRGLKPFFRIDDGIAVDSLFPARGNSLRQYPQIVRRLRRKVRESRADILIDVESILVLFSLPALAGLKVRHICWEHFNFREDLGKKGRRIARQLAARFCDAVVTLTERDKALWQQGTRSKASIRAIPNPLSIPVQETHVYPQQSTTVLAIGHPIRRKGFDRLVEAWKQVAPRAPAWKLQIIGLNEQERDVLGRACAQAGIARSVELIPPVSAIDEYYRQAAIFCLPSRAEGFPMVLLECLAFGLPVVSFDCDTGPSEILQGCGIDPVENGNVEALAEQLLALMEAPERRQKISGLTKAKAEHYHPRAIVQEWLELLSSKDQPAWKTSHK